MSPESLLGLRYIDGNWIDIVSFVTSLAYAGVRHRRSSSGRPFLSRSTAADVANGVSLFPLALLGASFLSSALLAELLHANRLILSVAGLTALFAMLEDWNEA